MRTNKKPLMEYMILPFEAIHFHVNFNIYQKNHNREKYQFSILTGGHLYFAAWFMPEIRDTGNNCPGHYCYRFIR
jgi:hypothetical protein